MISMKNTNINNGVNCFKHKKIIIWPVNITNNKYESLFECHNIHTCK